MGDIDRVQRIAPVAPDPSRVHKADEARDGHRQKPQQDSDTVELTVESQEESPPTPVVNHGEEGHLDIAV